MEVKHIELMVSVELHSGCPVAAALYSCGEDGVVDHLVAVEDFGPFDTLWDVAHWVGRQMIRQSVRGGR